MRVIDTYLTDAVGILTPAPVDKFGEPAGEATFASTKARVNWTTKLVRNFAGEQVIAAGTVWLAHKPEHTDRIRIDGVDHAILSIAEKKSWNTVYFEAAIT